MFRDQVMEHYRVRGYALHPGAKVRGRSGTVYRCDLVAEGPLGSLVISFGDAGGFEGPELSSVKRTAQDIGAAPVVAAPHLPDNVHRAAREMGVIILDEEAVGTVDVDEEGDEPEPDHPWPDPDRPQRRPAAEAARPAASVSGASGSVLWRHPRGGPADAGPGPGDEEPEAAAPAAPAPSMSSGRFTWLPGQAHEETRGPASSPSETRAQRRGPVPRPPVDLPHVEDRPRRRVLEVKAPGGSPSRWGRVWGPVLYGVVTALVLFLLAVLFL